MYDGCDFPLHEYLFSLVGFQLSFNNSEVRVLNHLDIFSYTKTSNEISLCQGLSILV